MQNNVRTAYAGAWADRRRVITVAFALQLIGLAVVMPLLGALTGFAVSLSDQSALTDQDIARFLLTPLGFLLGLGVVSVWLVVTVLGTAVMTVMLVQPSLVAALGFLAGRWGSLLSFAALFVLRVLALALPFLLIAGLAALRLLGDYDINYYLSARPPEFIWTVAISAVLFTGLAILLMWRLLSWAVALHCVIFRESPAFGSFGMSERRMAGQRWRLARSLVVWFLVRLVALALVAAAAAILLQVLPRLVGGHLRLALTVVLSLAALWATIRIAVSGLCLGALARLLFAAYGKTPEVTQTSSAGVLSARAVLLGGVVLAAFGVGAGALLLDRVQTEDNVVVIGHRGAAAFRPENTLASIEKAVEDGADWVEIDVQETADGEVVVIHDSDFMKLAGVDLKIWDATMDDLSGIDIGSWFDPAYADQRTPTLAQALDLTRDKAVLLIELKYYGYDVDLEGRVARIVEAAEMQDQVALMSLKYDGVRKMRALRPDWPVGVLAATAVGDLTGLEGDFLAVNTGQASGRLARASQAAGKDFFVWTVNDAVQMSAMISMGADGLITDDPALAREVLAARAEMGLAERVALLLAHRFGVRLASHEPRDASP